LGKAVPLHPAQRGFRLIDGTLANLVLLEHYVKATRLKGKSYTVVSLDVRKAFDTVSHDAILRALRRLNLDLGLQDYIWSTPADAHTTISVGGHCTRSIYINNGVKQRDSLSRLLFNAALDELICIVNERQPGETLTRSRFGYTNLLGNDDGLSLGFWDGVNPSINPSVLQSQTPSFPGRAIQDRGPYSRSAGPSSIPYLRFLFGSQGALKPSLHNLIGWLNNLERCPLKPHQKFSLTYLVPRLYYGLQSPALTGGILQEGDRLIRRSARRILYLNAHTGSQFLHARIGDSSLGLVQLRYKLPMTLLRRLDNLSREKDTTRWKTIFNNDGPAQSRYYRVKGLASRGQFRPLLEQTDRDTTLQCWFTGCGR
ncbi:hypothetical protein Trydic_g18524, partial [Trypoxylus dichotomus]